VEEDDAFFFPVAFVALSPAEDEDEVEEEGADFFFCFLSPDANDPFPFVLVPDDDVDVSFEAPSPPLPPNNAFTCTRARPLPPRLLLFDDDEGKEEGKGEEFKREDEEV
jgi:hypothetical protein